MQDDLDRADNPLAAKVPANFRFQIDRLAMGGEKPSKRLQRQQGLLFGTKKPQMQAEAMEPGSSAFAKRRKVMHDDCRTLAYQRWLTKGECDRFFPAQHINRVALRQITDHPEILA